ncbi:MAG: putative transport system permease protein, partial [Actinomycetota bacterium]|nr:putative transport system permease protein [Actinomycetota bacterium]
LVVLIALAAGAAMAAAAGARRTESAYPRFVAAQRAFDVSIEGFPDNVVAESARARIVGLSRVADWSRLDDIAQQAVLPSGRVVTAPELLVQADLQDRLGRTMNRFKVVTGRAFDPRASGEAVIDFSSAARLRLHVGNVITLILADPPTVQHRRSESVRIVGLVAAPGLFPAIGVTAVGLLFTSPAFVTHFGVRPLDSALLLRLRHGERDVPGFLRDLRGAGLGGADVQFAADQTVGIRRSIRYEVLALWALAGLVAITAFAVLGQSLARQVSLDSTDHAILRAIGMSRTQLFGLGMVRVTVVATAGAALAVPVAWVLSWWMPVGLARVAEPTPGFAADPLVWVAGVLATVGGLVAAGAFPAWRAAAAVHDRPGTVTVTGTGEHPSRVAAAVARVSPWAAAAVGVRMAVQRGRGNAAVPVRSAALGSAVAVVALVTSLVVGASLGRLLDTPRLSGITWDLFLSPASSKDEAKTSVAIVADPDVAVVGRGGFTAVEIAGRQLVAFFVQGDPSLLPPIVSGRKPVGEAEIAVGPEVMREAQVGIGSTVDVAAQDAHGQQTRLPMVIVGKAVIPPSPFGQPKPGDSVILTPSAYDRFFPGTSSQIPFLIRFKGGVDREAASARLSVQLPSTFLLPTTATTQAVALGGIATIPLVISAVLAGLAAGALGHTLLTSIRRRRRDFAILKAIGFVPGQIAGVVAWQATILAAWAGLVGVPLGIALGRWTWRSIADQAGVDPSIVYPLLIASILPAAVVLANVLALIPARLAAHTQVAQALRSE